jgi:hypothetical protein
MLDYIKEVIKPDLFFWTGDNAPHYVWGDTEVEAAMATVNITLHIKEAFKDTNITVFPI